MKKIVFIIAALALMSMTQGDSIITRNGQTTIINTTALPEYVDGYSGLTPLKIHIENNRIVKIEALHNGETPKFFAKVKQNLLNKWNGMSVNKAMKAKVDGATGATYSSNAVKENVRRGLEYYKKNKK